MIVHKKCFDDNIMTGLTHCLGSDSDATTGEGLWREVMYIHMYPLGNDLNLLAK